MTVSAGYLAISKISSNVTEMKVTHKNKYGIWFRIHDSDDNKVVKRLERDLFIPF